MSSGPDTTHVVAQGTFDILHPGHVHYLRDSAAMGDRLSVIVARAPNVTHKPDPVVPVGQRVEMVGALDPVEKALKGHPEDIFVPIEEMEPDVIALGYDQHHDKAAIESALAERGVDCDVRRASPRSPREEEELLSTGQIIEAVLETRG